MAEFHWRRSAQVGDGSVFEISGEIDSTTADAFGEMLESVREKGARRIVLDFTAVKYVNSAGLGVLVREADALKNVGGRLALAHVQKNVQDVVDTLGLGVFFHMSETAEEARATLGF
jgi:anti-anti-sigma factor